MIYLIITTSLIKENYEFRKQQYITGIKSILETIKNKPITPIIVENNGKRETFLDLFGVNVLYTDNNASDTNKGNKELQDIHECIRTYNIQDSDLIIKFTGRYRLNKPDVIDFIEKNAESYDCFLRYGRFEKLANHQVKDCITGLIALRSSLIKQIKLCGPNECIEWNWAEVTFNSRVKIFDSLNTTLFIGHHSVIFNV
jgi:hypothetical protein